MAVAFKGNTIAIIILCVVTIVVFVMYGFDKIKTNDEEPNIPNLAAASKHHIRKKDYVGALTEAVRQIRVDTNLIHQRLEMDYEPWQDFYMMIWNMPEHAWEIIRYKFAVKILKGFLEQQPPSFTMIFTGTSVTAGHESFYSRSYVGIIEERLKKSLTAAGVNLIVRNAAQPAFGCQVNNYCFPSLSIGPGEEIDFFAWENTFNCGAENAPSLEYFSRIAAQHKAIAFYSASGGAPLNNCQPSPDPVPYVSYDWTPEVAGITHTYAPSMAKVSEYKAKMVKRFHLGSAADRLVRLSQRPYKGTAPHGMSMYARTREACNATQVLNPKYVPSTSRAATRRQLAAKDVEPSSITMPMTRKAAPAAANAAAKAASASAASTGAPASAATAKAAKPSNKNATTNAIPPTRSPVATCATNDLWATMCHDQGGPKILTKEFSFKGNAPGVVQGRASYNPSAGSHLLRAELFLYNYNHVLLDAIFNLQKDLSLISAKHHNDPDGMFRHQLDVYERKLAGLQRTLTTPLAEPKHCPAWECGNPMENTQCFTDYQPNYLAAGPATGAAASTAAAATTAVTRDHTLSSLVMGNATKAGWQRVEKNMLSAKQFGNKDRQIYFYTDEFNARLPIALVLPHGKAQLARNAKEADMTGETEGIVKLFAGSDKATLEHAEFYLELDVATTDAELFALQRRVQDRLYAAANKTPVKLIKDVHYVYAKGHVHFFGLPKGYHILFVQSPTEQVSSAVAQRMTAAYAKAYREQQEDSDVSTTAAATATAKKTSKVAGATTTATATATATKKKPAAKAVAADGDERRRLAATDASSATSAKSLLKPKADANGEEGNKKEEEKKKGPRVVDATTIAKVSVGQMVVF